MIKKLKQWHKRRQLQKQWEQEQELEAQRLHSLYKQSLIEIDNLTEAQKVELGAMVLDPRFDNVIKMARNIKNRYLKSVAFSKDHSTDDVYRGGAMAMTAFIVATQNITKGAYTDIQEENNKRAVLDMVGW